LPFPYRFHIDCQHDCISNGVNLELRTQRKMAEASAADGKMKDLKISETKKNKKDGAPKTAAKKPQQQKKKVGQNCKMSSSDPRQY
jgi:hypothetical protein